MASPLLGCYLTHLQAGGVSGQTVYLRRHYLRRLADSYPDRDLAALTLDDLEAFLAHSGWAAETRKSARTAVRGFYRWAYETGRVSSDPSRLLPAVRVPPGRPRPAPDDVFYRAMATATPSERLMVMLGAYAGLRRAEIACVHSSDVLGDVLRVKGKGGKVRHVPLHPALAATLATRPPGWAFPSHGGHLTPGHVGVVLRRLLGPGWTAHTLRHRFASLAFAAERDLLAVCSLLGHSKPETTMRYCAIPNGALRSAVLAAGSDAA